MWRDIAARLYSPRVLQGLPRYIDRIAFRFHDEDATTIPARVKEGDVATFVAALIRIDQIERAKIDAGQGSTADLAPVIYARHLVEGLRDAAEIALKKNGGTWPPIDPEPAGDSDGSQ